MCVRNINGPITAAAAAEGQAFIHSFSQSEVAAVRRNKFPVIFIKFAHLFPCPEFLPTCIALYPPVPVVASSLDILFYLKDRTVTISRRLSPGQFQSECRIQFNATMRRFVAPVLLIGRDEELN